MVVVDGQGGFGQMAARLAVGELTSLTTQHGAAAAAIRRANHVGRLGEWVECSPTSTVWRRPTSTRA